MKTLAGKHLITLLILALCQGNGFAQKAFPERNLKKGFYKSFAEFRSNSPGIPFDEGTMKFDESNETLHNSSLTNIYSIRRGTFKVLRLREKASNKRVSAKAMWAYCDGQRIFLNSYMHDGGKMFVELLVMGRYCYFIQKRDLPLFPEDHRRPDYGNTQFDSHVDQYVININNGKIFRLYKRILEMILKSDAELFAEMKRDKDIKNKLLIDYIRRYNERHADEIKPYAK